MGQCYLCNQSLNNEKPEHIIPNAIGGKLKSRYVLCSKCNNAYSDIDNKLCLDLKLLTNFICPQRDNNKNTIPSIKTQCRDGEYIRYADGSYRKSSAIAFKDGNTIHLNFEHTPNSQAEKYDLKYLENIFSQIAKKQHKDKEWVIQHLSQSLKKAIIRQRDNDVHHFQFCANESGYSFLGVLKIVLGFCAFKKVNNECLQRTIDILKNRDIKACNKITNYFNDNSIFPKDSVYHTIYLNGNRDTKLLYAIVSLYGVFNTFCLVSDNYTGENVTETYCYDLINNKFKSFSITYNANLDKVQEILNEIIDTIIATENFNIFMKFFMMKDKTNYLLKVMEQLMSYIMQLIVMNYPILDKTDYSNTYAALFIKEFKEQPNVKFVSDNDIKMFSKIIIEQIHTYNLYRYNKEAMELIGNTVTFLFNKRCESKEELFSYLCEHIAQYKSEIPEVNDIFQSNKTILQDFLVCHYKKILKNPYFKEFLLKS